MLEAVPLLLLAVGAFGIAAYFHGGTGGIGVGRLPYWFLFFGIGLIASGGSFGVVLLAPGPSPEAATAVPDDRSFVRIPSEEWAEIRAQLAAKEPAQGAPPTSDYAEAEPPASAPVPSLPIAAAPVESGRPTPQSSAAIVAQTWPDAATPVPPPVATREVPPGSPVPVAAADAPAALPTGPPTTVLPLPPAAPRAAQPDEAADPAPSARPLPPARLPLLRPIAARPLILPALSPDGPECASCGKRMSARGAWRKCSVCGKPLCASCLTASVRQHERGYCSACMPASAAPASS